MRITDVNIDSRPRNRNPVTENEDKVTLVIPHSIEDNAKMGENGEEIKPSSVEQVASDQYGEPLNTRAQPAQDSQDGQEPEEEPVSDDMGDAPEPVEEPFDMPKKAEPPVREDEPIQEAQEPEPEPEEPQEGEVSLEPQDEPVQEVQEPQTEETSEAPEQEPVSDDVGEPPEPVDPTVEPSHVYDSSIRGSIKDALGVMGATWKMAKQQADEITDNIMNNRKERNINRKDVAEKKRLAREERKKKKQERQERRKEKQNNKPPKKGNGGTGGFFAFGKRGKKPENGRDGQQAEPNGEKSPGVMRKADKVRLTAKERALERKRAKYDLILSGKLVNPDKGQYKSIWKNMVKDGYVEYRRMEYVIGIDRYRIDCSIIKHEDLPLGQHHVTGCPYTYAYDVNGVSFSSSKNNNFTAVSQYNYMHNRVFDDAMSYKWGGTRQGKKNAYLFYIIGIIVFAVGFGIYFMFMR